MNSKTLMIQSFRVRMNNLERSRQLKIVPNMTARSNLNLGELRWKAACWEC